MVYFESEMNRIDKMFPSVNTHNDNSLKVLLWEISLGVLINIKLLTLVLSVYTPPPTMTLVTLAWYKICRTLSITSCPEEDPCLYYGLHQRYKTSCNHSDLLTQRQKAIHVYLWLILFLILIGHQLSQVLIFQ